MNLCDSGHDEICHEGRQCPFCAKIEEKDQEISDLNMKIDDLRDALSEAQSQLD
jgi:TolA-binding protein